MRSFAVLCCCAVVGCSTQEQAGPEAPSAPQKSPWVDTLTQTPPASRNSSPAPKKTPSARKPKLPAFVHHPEKEKEMTHLEKVFSRDEIAKLRAERETEFLRSVDVNQLPKVCEHRDGWQIILQGVDRLDSSSELDFAEKLRRRRRLYQALLIPEAEGEILQAEYVRNIPDSYIARFTRELDSVHAVSILELTLYCEFMESRPRAAKDALPTLKKLYLRNSGSEQNRVLGKAIRTIQEANGGS